MSSEVGSLVNDLDQLSWRDDPWPSIPTGDDVHAKPPADERPAPVGRLASLDEPPVAEVTGLPMTLASVVRGAVWARRQLAGKTAEWTPACASTRGRSCSPGSAASTRRPSTCGRGEDPGASTRTVSTRNPSRVGANRRHVWATPDSAASGVSDLEAAAQQTHQLRANIHSHVVRVHFQDARRCSSPRPCDPRPRGRPGGRRSATGRAGPARPVTLMALADPCPGQSASLGADRERTPGELAPRREGEPA